MTPKKTNDLFNGLFTEIENFFKEKGYNTWHSSSCCEDELVLRANFPRDSWVRKVEWSIWFDYVDGVTAYPARIMVKGFAGYDCLYDAEIPGNDTTSFKDRLAKLLDSEEFKNMMAWEYLLPPHISRAF